MELTGPGLPDGVYIFKPKIPNWVNFGRFVHISYGHLLFVWPWFYVDSSNKDISNEHLSNEDISKIDISNEHLLNKDILKKP
jgi:hypothetical protein